MNKKAPPISNAPVIGPSLAGDEVQQACHGNRAWPTGKHDRHRCRVRPIYRRLSRHAGVLPRVSDDGEPAAAARAPFELATAAARSLRALALNERRHRLVLPTPRACVAMP